MSKNIQEELKLQVQLLHQEKEEDLRQYRLKMSSTSLKERRKAGVCWYPVDLNKTRFDAGERLIVKVSRQPEHTDAHLFQSGKLISMFSNSTGDSQHEEAVSGVVNSVTKTDMHITLNVDDVPQWVHHGQLGIQLLFDENAYREMEKALFKVIKSKGDRIEELKNVILGTTAARFDNQEVIRDIGLNDSQNEALRLVHNAQDVAIIHGPPGTGKTTTLVHTIAETLKSEKQVMVCAPSNAAVDLLTDRLGQQNIEVLRIGHPARVHEDILNKTLDAKIANHDDFKSLKDMRKQAEEYFKLASKYKRNFGHAEKAQRRAIKAEALKLKDAANNLEYYIINDIVAKTQVIACTLVGSTNSYIKGMSFGTVFIDEAAQAMEAATWIPILKAQRVIFAGDHCQLPPTIKSYEAAKKGLEVTLFEKAIDRNEADVMLSIQYRMHEQIMNFSSRTFYKNNLTADAMVKDWKVFGEDSVVEFIDTAGCAFYEAVDKETRSSFNEEEADIVMKHLIEYLGSLDSMERQEDLESVGIISPYKAQTALLSEKLLASGLAPDTAKKVQVNTVDSFQGQERDVIYISLVRSNDKGEIGFLKDTRRMNVALTRARKKLVVIGDSATIGQHSFYEKFLDYIHEIDAYRSAFELMY
ncbi:MULTISPECIES: AAA domain-containing protein [Reichenbachiella]|uniref:DNA helicase n=1 Tax=Reichenbachiella agariperforans TaxID=156994 RepID=A0A1M6V6X1_REIAG|nr:MULTISPECIES: AAA domain-containing protein [Reichenbachiella]MBU2912890.1 AAA family ATPase [Reichenbachiella agariperforans]RJE72799.1 DNA-binding protein [Reichenbachiella sp. MSK19-1]SHK77212.1 DNA helicase, putative [Reichenbachiella agariperforans]